MPLRAELAERPSLPRAPCPEQPRRSAALARQGRGPEEAAPAGLGALSSSSGHRGCPGPVSLALQPPAGMLVGVHYANSIRISGQWKRTCLSRSLLMIF